MITKREIFLIVLFCFAVSAITAQPIIKGTVTDKQTGETLVGVNIFLPDYSKGAVSDKNGNYILKGLHKGEVIVN